MASARNVKRVKLIFMCQLIEHQLQDFVVVIVKITNNMKKHEMFSNANNATKISIHHLVDITKEYIVRWNVKAQRLAMRNNVDGKEKPFND